MIYYLQAEFVVDGEADVRFANPSYSEVCRAEKVDFHHGFNRVIGGDKGDLLFDSYEIDGGETTLNNAALSTVHEGLTDDEVMDIAREIFDSSFSSIGWECIY